MVVADVGIVLWGPEGQNVSAEEGISELTHGATPTSRKRAPIPKPALEAVAKVQKARGRVVGSPNSRKGQTRMSSARTLVVAYHCLRFLANNSISEGDTIPKTVDLGIRKDLPDDIKFHYGTKLGLHNVLGQTKGLRGIIGDKIDWLRSKVSTVPQLFTEFDLLTAFCRAMLRTTRQVERSSKLERHCLPHSLLLTLSRARGPIKSALVSLETLLLFVSLFHRFSVVSSARFCFLFF